MNRLPTIRETAARTLYVIMYDGKPIYRSLGYVDVMSKLNKAILKYGSGVKLSIQ